MCEGFDLSADARELKPSSVILQSDQAVERRRKNMFHLSLLLALPLALNIADSDLIVTI